MFMLLACLFGLGTVRQGFAGFIAWNCYTVLGCLSCEFSGFCRFFEMELLYSFGLLTGFL